MCWSHFYTPVIWRIYYGMAFSVLGCSNLVRTLHMERGRSLFIFKVIGLIARSLGLYKEFCHLDPCRQDIARTMESRVLKLSMHTSYGKWKKPFFQGQSSRSLGLYKEFWHFDSCGQDIARIMQSRLLKLSMYTSYGKRKKPIKFQCQCHWAFLKNFST